MRDFIFKKLVFIVILAVPAANAGEMLASKAKLHQLDHGHEALLVSALERVRQGNTRAALPLLEQLVEVNPKFKLAQLIYADLLLAQSRPIRDFGNLSSAPYQQIVALRDEAQARWRHHLSPPQQNRLPAALIKLSKQQKHAIVVDMNTSRLYLYENNAGEPKLVQDFYTTIGKKGVGKYLEGDQKTPVGVYFVTGFIEPEELPDLYGDGAFPIDYPNVWDQRHGRTGYGIWLHGTPSATFSRPPRDSNGCVIVSNKDLNTIAPYVRVGTTPVILADNIDWIGRDEWKKKQSQFDGFLEKWRKDWESRDAELYLSHYSKQYSGLGKNYDSWVEYKRRVNPSKRFIKVGLSEKSMFLYPGEKALLVVTFEQDYASDNVTRRFIKRQYWQQDKDGQWRIVYEGSVS
ncbi:MAG: L,D-transpeptidase family protein [Gammaproteobacteria bacterium]|nr:L,D-transpeptidase family protein [Gammaproteobacteria bacterium]